MTASEKRVLGELVNECWENAASAQADDINEVAQYLKAHYYLMRFNNEVVKMKHRARKDVRNED